MTEEKAVAVREESNFLTIIDKAVSGGMSADTIHKLIDAQERVIAKQAEMNFNSAMARLQPLLPVIQHDSEIRHSGKLISGYSSYEAIDKQIRPLYTKEGFSLSFNSKKQADGTVTYYGTISHVDGHSRTAEMDLPADSSGAKNAIQAKGSTISYAKRYLVTMLLNLVTSGEDDDGEKGGTEFINDEQIATIREWIESTNADQPKFLEYMGVKSITDIKASDYAKAINAFQAKANKK